MKKHNTVIIYHLSALRGRKIRISRMEPWIFTSTATKLEGDTVIRPFVSSFFSRPILYSRKTTVANLKTAIMQHELRSAAPSLDHLLFYIMSKFTCLGQIAPQRPVPAAEEWCFFTIPSIFTFTFTFTIHQFAVISSTNTPRKDQNNKPLTQFHHLLVRLFKTLHDVDQST